MFRRTDNFRRTMAAAALGSALVGGVAAAQPATVGGEVGRWKLEQLHTKDGRVFSGVLHQESRGEVEFIEVVQPRGKPMFLVVRPVDRDEIATLQKLPPDEHEELAARVYRFRNRTRVEAGRMEDVTIDTKHIEGLPRRSYIGPWFTLTSTADEETTRRCVVRIEQIFRAYRQLLPPRSEKRTNLSVTLFGSMDEYRGYLFAGQFDLDNPAIYSEKANVILAASDLSGFADRLAKSRAHHAAIRQQYDARSKAMPAQIEAMMSDLRKAGFSEQQLRDERRARERAWQENYAVMVQQLDAADRRNEARFREVTAEMFQRLYHEGFHAYVENYVYPHDQFDLPIWLNEGLAQVFQSGQLESETLRIDAPLSEALKLVKGELAAGNPLHVRELLSARRSEFLASDDNVESAKRFYAWSWALAYYLTFHQPLLGTKRMDDFVAKDAANLPAAARFEKLTGKTLQDFEKSFYETMQGL